MSEDDFQYRTIPTTKQLKFRAWSDPDAPQNYWRDIDTLAFFIGAALNYGGDTTINVKQTKEKFGDAMVYCSLADFEQVTSAYECSDSFMPGNVPEDFKFHCLTQDAIHYRAVYQRMMKLVPQYYIVIRNGAEFPGLICETKAELDELIASPFYSGTGGFDIKDPNQLTVLYKLCGFVE